MLLVDPRVGSRDLLEPLQRFGVPAEIAPTPLDYGDFAFIGRGLHGTDLYIGVELKRMSQDLGSSIRSKRFVGHQLGGLVGTDVRAAAYDRVWLITEGIWRADTEGVFQVFNGGSWTMTTPRLMAAEVEQWLLTISIRGGIFHWHAPTRRDTVRFLSSLYHWWTDKDLDAHRSHAAIYIPPPDRASLVEPSAFVKGLTGLVVNIGWIKAAAVEQACGASFVRLCAMSASELQRIPGIGKTLAAAIVESLQGASK